MSGIFLFLVYNWLWIPKLGGNMGLSLIEEVKSKSQESICFYKKILKISFFISLTVVLILFVLRATGTTKYDYTNIFFPIVIFVFILVLIVVNVICLYLQEYMVEKMKESGFSDEDIEESFKKAFLEEGYVDQFLPPC